MYPIMIKLKIDDKSYHVLITWNWRLRRSFAEWIFQFILGKAFIQDIQASNPTLRDINDVSISISIMSSLFAQKEQKRDWISFIDFMRASKMFSAFQFNEETQFNLMGNPENCINYRFTRKCEISISSL